MIWRRLKIWRGGLKQDRAKALRIVSLIKEIDGLFFDIINLPNYWTQLSIDFANQRNYLDELFSVYPTIPEGIRTISETLWSEVEQSFDQVTNNLELFKALLKFDLFPIKDSYIAYFKRDKSAIERKFQTLLIDCVGDYLKWV